MLSNPIVVQCTDVGMKLSVIEQDNRVDGSYSRDGL